MRCFQVAAIAFVVQISAFAEADYKPGFFRKTFLPLLADKSAELFQGDFCRVFMSYDPAWCDVAENLPLSKAVAKGLGAGAKAWQSEAGPYNVFTSLLSGYLGTRLFDVALAADTTFMQSVFLAVYAPVAHLFVEDTDFKKWLGEPFSKTAALGSKLLLERRLEEVLFSDQAKNYIAGMFASVYVGVADGARQSKAFARAMPQAVAKIGAAMIITSGLNLPALVTGTLSIGDYYEKLKENTVIAACQGFVISTIMILAGPSAGAGLVWAANAWR